MLLSIDTLINCYKQGKAVLHISRANFLYKMQACIANIVTRSSSYKITLLVSIKDTF